MTLRLGEATKEFMDIGQEQTGLFLRYKEKIYKPLETAVRRDQEVLNVGHVILGEKRQQ